MRPRCLCVDGRKDNPPQIEEEAARDGEAPKMEVEKSEQGGDVLMYNI